MKHIGGLSTKSASSSETMVVRMMRNWQVPGDHVDSSPHPRPCVYVHHAGQFEWRKASLTEVLSMQKSKCFVACLREHSERGLPLANVRNEVTV